MNNIFDLEEFNQYKEDNRREVKKARGGLPVSLWETYSSFANTDGGVIILGVDEKDDKTWATAGLKVSDEAQLLKTFWDTVNNQTKMSTNLLTEKDINSYYIGDDLIIVINIPKAKREERPVYINNDMFKGTYKRNGEGDYHCSRAEVKAMLRDAAEETMDNKVLDNMSLEIIDRESLRSYRNRHQLYKAGHVFENDTDEEYLRRIGAAAYGRDGKTLYPTAAGLLMFGHEYDIVREFPYYFLDYREMLDPSIRWTDRLQSSSGDWTGNVMEFFFRVNNKLCKDIKIPFKLDGIVRIDDTPVHKAVREALINCLVNADYYQPRGVVIKKEANEITMENPGSIRTGKLQMLRGGISDPRNATLLKMFNLIGYGERAGSGVPDIFAVWNSQGWETPVIDETSDPDRTILHLKLETSYEDVGKEQETTQKTTQKTAQKIVDLIRHNPSITRAELAAEIGITSDGIKYHIKRLKDNGVIERIGSDKSGQWIIIEDSK